MKRKRMLSFLLVGVLLFSMFPLSISAEETEQEAPMVMTEETKEDLDPPKEVINDETSEIKIMSVDEVGDVSKEENTEEQLVVFYKEAKENNIETLELTTKEVKGADRISKNVDLIEVSPEKDMDEMTTEIKSNPNVLAVDKNLTIELNEVPNDPLITNDAAWQFKKIGADKTWNKVSNETPVVIAVIDTGADTTHEDLEGIFTTGYDMLRDTEDVIDLYGHGTMVAGMISAVSNNGLGLAGISGNANIKIAPYRAGGTSATDKNLNLAYVVAGIAHAAEREEVKGINMSFGLYKENAVLKAAVDYASDRGKILVSSAGNEGNKSNAGEYCYPGSMENVISVAATGKSDNHPPFSQYNDRVDLSAPGEEIRTTYLDNQYVRISGTSFAAPIISGAAGVLMAVDPELTPLEVERILKSTATDLGEPGKDDYFGEGLLNLEKALEEVQNLPKEVLPLYRTHIEEDGWENFKADGEMAGTQGERKRLEAIEIKLKNKGYDLGVKYRTHVENLGWQEWKADEEPSGTTGSALRLEAINLSLTGGDADKFDVYYSVHAQEFGWLDWAKNGEAAGTEGYAYRLEAIKIKILPKGATPPGKTENPFMKKEKLPTLTYRTHVEDLDWQEWKINPEASGTSGQSKRLEGIEIRVKDSPTPLGIEYQTHIQDLGWETVWKKDGEMSGTSGSALRLEAIQLRLTGESAKNYDLYYRVHAQEFGWLDFGKNGEPAGTAGYAYRLEAIEIQVLKKGENPPGKTGNSFISK